MRYLVNKINALLACDQTGQTIVSASMYVWHNMTTNPCGGALLL